MDHISIRVTDAFYPLQLMFHRNGLEANLAIRDAKDVLRMWEAVDENGERLGAIKLEIRSGELVVGGIAVEEQARGLKLGTALLETALSFCRSLKYPRLLLVAKAPDFFKKAGFRHLEMEPYQHIIKCYTCLQRDVSCFPELLFLDL